MRIAWHTQSQPELQVSGEIAYLDFPDDAIIMFFNPQPEGGMQTMGKTSKAAPKKKAAAKPTGKKVAKKK